MKSADIDALLADLRRDFPADLADPAINAVAYAKVATIRAVLDDYDRLSTALRQERDRRARRLEETIYLDGRIAELRSALERARVALEEIKNAGLGRFGRRPDDIAAEALAEIDAISSPNRAGEIIPSSHGNARAAEPVTGETPVGSAAQSCTCHPDDEPPVPCPRKYALGDCRAAALTLAQAKLDAVAGLADALDQQAGVEEDAARENRRIMATDLARAQLYAARAARDAAARIRKLLEQDHG